MTEENTYFVSVPVDGREERWPEDGKVLMRYKGMGTTALGMVRASSPEEAVRLFLDYSENAPPEIAEEIRSRALGPASVGVLTEVVEVPL